MRVTPRRPHPLNSQRQILPPKPSSLYSFPVHHSHFTSHSPFTSHSSPPTPRLSHLTSYLSSSHLTNRVPLLSHPSSPPKTCMVINVISFSLTYFLLHVSPVTICDLIPLLHH